MELLTANPATLFTIDNAPMLFFIASALVSMFTRKDLAFWCSCGFLLSYLVSEQSWVYETTVLAYSSITVGVAFISAVHFKKGKYPLSLVICMICSLMLCNHLVQMIEFSMFTYWVSVALGIAMLLALIFIPGRKEWLNDMADDIGMFGNHGISNNGHHHDGGNLS